MKPSSRAFFKIPGRGYFHKQRHPLHSTAEANWERMHLCAKGRGRECMGWLQNGCGAVLVFEAQRNGDLVEVRVVEHGHLKATLRGTAARRWDAAH